MASLLFPTSHEKITNTDEKSMTAHMFLQQYHWLPRHAHGGKRNLCWYIRTIDPIYAGPPSKLCKAEQAFLGARGQAETSLSDDKQPEFRSLRDFYIIIFLNKLKIVENIDLKNINIKRLWLKIWDTSEIYRPFIGSPLMTPGLVTFEFKINLIRARLTQIV